MTEGKPFRSIRIAFLELVALDKDLPQSACRVATLMFGAYADYTTGECYPGQATIAGQLGISAKSVNRAVKAMKAADLIEVDHTTGDRRSLTYRPSEQAWKHAESQLSKGAKIVPFTNSETGQNRPVDGTRQAKETGHQSPTNLKQITNNRTQRPVKTAENGEPEFCRAFFVSLQDPSMEKWLSFIRRETGSDPETLLVPVEQDGHSGYMLPSRWPTERPDLSEEVIRELRGIQDVERKKRVRH